MLGRKQYDLYQKDITVNGDNLKYRFFQVQVVYVMWLYYSADGAGAAAGAGAGVGAADD